MKLYHIHRENKYDELFKEGNTIEFGTNNNFLKDSFYNNSSTFTTSEEMEDGKRILNYRSFSGTLKPEVFESYSKENQMQLLAMVRDYINLSSEYTREIILEEVRKKDFIERPSRDKCMFLTDEDSLDYWFNILSRNDLRFDYLSNDPIKVFEVEAEGNIFKTSSDLLPGIYDMNLNMYNSAWRYWNPSEYQLNNSSNKEYLFEGKAKILRRVK